MNLLHLQEQGEDLAGERHPQLCEQLARTHLYVAPMLNPDGRAVCPVSFYAGGLDTCVAYASGLQLDGRLVPYNADADKPCYYFDPAQALFVGGQFNGAGWWSRLIHITWPNLAPTTFFILVMSLISGFRGHYVAIHILTRGGPAGSTTNLLYHIYRSAFDHQNMGYACALAMVLFVLIFVCTLLNWRFGKAATEITY